MNEFMKRVIADIPVYFPLADWSALNPFTNCVHEPFHQTLRRLRKITAIEGYLSLHEYLKLFKENKINLSDIEQSFQEQKIPHISIDELFNVTIQNQLLYFSDNRNEHKDILISVQLFQQGFTDILEGIDIRIQNFLSAWFDQGIAYWKIPTDKTELFAGWCALTRLEDATWEKLISSLPNTAYDTCQHVLLHLSVPIELQEKYISKIIWRLIGWMSLIKCKNLFPNQPNIIRNSDLFSPVAIWLMHEWYYLNKLKLKYPNIKDNFVFQEPIMEDEEVKLHRHLMIWQRALEIHEHQLILSVFKNSKKPLVFMEKTAHPQWVFCMDPRSFRMRRYLEEHHHHSTIGAAGYFGFIFSCTNQTSQTTQWQSPALLSPSVMLQYYQEINTNNKLSAFFHKEYNALNDVKSEHIAPFFLFEMTGILFLFNWAAQTFFGRWYNKPSREKMVIDIWQSDYLPSGFSLLNAADAAELFLRQCGLTHDFSEYIVLCGHSTQVVNHPQRASFECGACGGHSGQSNAIVACYLLNDNAVRNELIKRNISIPEKTQFIPAMHETSTNQLYWLLENEKVPTLLRQVTDQINASIAIKKKVAKTVSDPYHWAELVPEYGLANHAALIIGQSPCAEKSLLEGRCFLQTYDASSDPDGQVLQNILESVAIVAQHINAQYYFSSTDAAILGGGNKALHNVVGCIGVMEGNQSDLKIGLSNQSLVWQGKRIHTPVRLLVIIMANAEFVFEAIRKTQLFQQLMKNEWLFVEIIEEQSS